MELLYKIVKKFFSKDDGLFHIVKRSLSSFQNDRIELTYPTFKEFYDALNGDLAGASLLGYDFDDCNPNEYDLSEVTISSKTMIKLGTYDDRLFKDMTEDKDFIENTPSESLNLVPVRELLPVDECPDTEDVVIMYISDLHIDHKLHNRFKEAVNESEIIDYFRSLLNKMRKTMPIFLGRKYILLVGDVSFNFKMAKLFFKVYASIINVNTFFILGNHELWDTNLIKKSRTIEKMVEEYRKFFETLHEYSWQPRIKLLENQLFFSNGNVMSAEQIMATDKQGFEKLWSRSGFAIFGGIGYAGLNDEFNCTHGIYRGALSSRKEEKERSKIVADIHEHLREFCADKKVFFVTHMQMPDWSSADYVRDWVYISGHNHRNFYCEDSDKTLYYDNQIGYKNSAFGLKFITASSRYDYFDNYPDGIHEISRQDYQLFYYGLGTRFAFTRDFYKLYMLKNSKTYCFLILTEPGGAFKLLNGGTIKNVGKYDLDYFYTNLHKYATSIKLFLGGYSDFQKNVSREIKMIGGSGQIHGCIVDIDFFNHLYLNPFDGTITPYFAYSMVDKYVYDNLPSLLKSECPTLFKNYKALQDNKNSSANLQLVKQTELITGNKTHYTSTEMYRISRVIKGLQFTTKFDVVRLWNDTIDLESSIEVGRLIVSGIVNPEEMKAIRTAKRLEEREIRALNKPSCPRIKKEVAKSSEEEMAKIKFRRYSERIASITNDNIRVLRYINATTKSRFKCNNCGHEWETRSDHLKDRQGYKCPVCKK